MNPVFSFLTYFVWFFATYFIIVFLLVLFSSKSELYETRNLRGSKRPLVTILVPAYNEEGKIHKTIASLKRLTYPKLEIIVINDGSRDGTAREVRQAIGRDTRFRFIDRAENRGKAASLNEGLRAAHGEYVACMDADSMLEQRMIEKTLPYLMDDPDMGAVTVSVAITRPKNALHRLIEIEYIVGLSLFLKVFSTFGCVFVTPGPYTLFRKRALDELRGFDVRNMTEDLEIAYRLHKAGWKITNRLDAVVRTVCPETFMQIYRQRRRWYTGGIQTLIKHRSMLFSSRYGYFGYFIPFNFFLIFSGLVLFITSTYLGVKNVITTVSAYQYTDLNLWQRLTDWQFDILRFRRVSLVGTLALAAGILVMVISMHVTKHRMRSRKTGVLAYPLLFFLYQFWWLGAVYTVLTRRKITWR